MKSRTVRALALLAVAGLAAVAGPGRAGANPPPGQEESGDLVVVPHEPPTVEVGGECGAPSLTFRNPTRYPIAFKYSEDGDGPHLVWVHPSEDEETVLFGPYEEESEHSLRYKIWLPGQDWVEVDVETDCLVEVTPLAPSASSPTCQNLANGQLLIPSQTGVLYNYAGGPAAPGEYRVVATPAEGYEFPAGAVTEWHLVVEEPGDCTGPQGPQGPPAPPAPPVVVQPIVIQQAAPATPVRTAPRFTG